MKSKIEKNMYSKCKPNSYNGTLLFIEIHFFK